MSIDIGVIEQDAGRQEFYKLLEKNLAAHPKACTYGEFLKFMPVVFLFRLWIGGYSFMIDRFNITYRSGKCSVTPVSSRYAQEKYPDAKYVCHCTFIDNATGEVNVRITYF